MVVAAAMHMQFITAKQQEDHAVKLDERSRNEGCAPATARRRFFRVVLVMRRMVLRRSISWRKCTVSGAVAPPCSLRSRSRISSLSNGWGTCAMCSMHAIS